MIGGFRSGELSRKKEKKKKKEKQRKQRRDEARGTRLDSLFLRFFLLQVVFAVLSEPGCGNTIMITGNHEYKERGVRRLSGEGDVNK